MLFNSVDFAVFLPIVFLVYWLLQHDLKLQNLFIVFASFLFYGWWDWRFLSLLLVSSLVDYFVGRWLQKSLGAGNRKLLLGISIIVNLGILGFFKYYNFFADNFVSAFRLFGMSFQARSLNVVLPVGISFYTFQALSYSIDVYRRKLEPTRDIIAFLAFVSFFPQLVAGPIERAANLLPQFYVKRAFDGTAAVDGLRQMLWGLFKKVVLADNCAIYVNQIFAHPAGYSGSTLLLGAVFFLFQIYCDFSGYSDIAIGTARLFGIRIMRNFAYPFFSRDIAEFWRRFHISLATWFRDYLYIPLGGSRGGTWKKAVNTFLIFLVSGLWHGANWTFLAWGALHAVCFLPLILTNRNRKNTGTVAAGRLLPKGRDLLDMGTTFFLVAVISIFFRSESILRAFEYLRCLFSPSLFRLSIEEIKRISVGAHIVYLVFFLLAFLCAEWLQREKQHPLQWGNGKVPKPVRYMVYYGMIALIAWFQGTQQAFVYFQF